MENVVFNYRYPWYSYRDGVKKIIIEEGITSIGDEAFNGYSNLKNVKLPSGLKVIGEKAFSGAGKLSEIFCITNRH